LFDEGGDGDGAGVLDVGDADAVIAGKGCLDGDVDFGF
jgi:hypothetical protein